MWALNALHGIRIVTSWIDGPRRRRSPGASTLATRLDALRDPSLIDAVDWMSSRSSIAVRNVHQRRARLGPRPRAQSVDPVARTLLAGVGILLETSLLVGLVVPGDTIVLVVGTAIDNPAEYVGLLGCSHRRRARRREPGLRCSGAGSDTRSALATRLAHRR